LCPLRGIKGHVEKGYQRDWTNFSCQNSYWSTYIELKSMLIVLEVEKDEYNPFGPFKFQF
jgi:hypothetical protein